MLIIPLLRSMMFIFLLAVAMTYIGAFIGLSEAFGVERPPGYRLRWSDEFSGSALNSSNWRAGKAPSHQVSVRDGRLILKASGSDPSSARHGAVRSGDNAYVNSWGLGALGATRSFAPGWLKFRVRTSDVRGVMGEIVLWSDWQEFVESPGDGFVAEIDVLENRGHESTVTWQASHQWRYVNWTFPPERHNQGGTSPINRRAWVIYDLHWSEDYVRIYVNGKLRHERDMDEDIAPVFGTRFVVAMSCWVATAGSWQAPNGVDWDRVSTGPTMEVDYVRYYAP